VIPETEPPGDLDEIARGYAAWPDRGPPHEGRRATIMVERDRFRAGDKIRVRHVLEILDAGGTLYVMGPKPVYGERLDGVLVTEPPPEDDDPFLPPVYDGPSIPGPGVDCNFEVTTYSFPEPGTHTIVWKLDGIESNVLTLAVAAGG
jgi:hypothetical protein